jgi:hypothetical protein
MTSEEEGSSGRKTLTERKIMNKSCIGCRFIAAFGHPEKLGDQAPFKVPPRHYALPSPGTAPGY